MMYIHRIVPPYWQTGLGTPHSTTAHPETREANRQTHLPHVTRPTLDLGPPPFHTTHPNPPLLQITDRKARLPWSILRNLGSLVPGGPCRPFEAPGLGSQRLPKDGSPSMKNLARRCGNGRGHYTGVYEDMHIYSVTSLIDFQLRVPPLLPLPPFQRREGLHIDRTFPSARHKCKYHRQTGRVFEDRYLSTYTNYT